MGRPKKEIDYELAEKLARLFCTQEDIATILNVSKRTLLRDAKFLDTYHRAIETSKASLRRMQFKAAEEGNVTMMIWLGKQYLGQRDNKTYDGGFQIEVEMVSGDEKANEKTTDNMED